MPNAIISVYDKTDLTYLGKILSEKGFQIFATHGTRIELMKSGIQVFPVEKIAKNPLGFENIVSSLSFNTLIGTLSENRSLLLERDICSLDAVIYNFVPTWDIIHTAKDFNIQNVDLGGPTMIKAAAINYKNVLPIISPNQYQILSMFPHIPMSTRVSLAKIAMEYCAEYDRKLADLLGVLKA